MNVSFPFLRRGSTWPDILAVVAVIGILTGITVPMMLSARHHASRARCTDNLREIGQAMSKYAELNHGRLPCTRPSRGPVAIPDVSNSGCAVADPFGEDGPVPNNVPAAMFLLIRCGLLDSTAFICPGSAGQPDRFDGHEARQRSNFTDVQLNLTYAMQNPYVDDSVVAGGFEWRLNASTDMVLVADRGPDSRLLKDLDPDSPTERLRMANSANHERYGQNVLYSDGRVEYHDSPFAGTNRDHIYLNKSGRQLDSPSDAEDTLLLPGE
ncbi:MAG: type IV pilin protein [Tepidisphaerales bacterium]